MYNAVNSCEKLVGAALSVADNGDTFECTVPDSFRHDEQVQLLLRSFEFGIEQVAASYPDFVRIKSR